MQEEITQKTLALCVETGKITAQLLQQAMKKVLADMEKHMYCKGVLPCIGIYPDAIPFCSTRVPRGTGRRARRK